MSNINHLQVQDGPLAPQLQSALVPLAQFCTLQLDPSEHSTEQDLASDAGALVWVKMKRRQREAPTRTAHLDDIAAAEPATGEGFGSQIDSPLLLQRERREHT
jgi:hypothetical protein